MTEPVVRPAVAVVVRPAVAVVVSRFPLVTETFVLREIQEMERQGQAVVLAPLLRERPAVVHREALPWLDRLLHEPWTSPALLGATLRALATRPLRSAATLAGLLARSLPDANLVLGALAAFPKAAHAAQELPRRGVRHVHAQFATHPTATALAACALKPESLTFSFTAHAHDVMVHRAGLGAKVRRCRFARSISEFNRAILARAAPDAADRVKVIHVGIDPGDPPREAPSSGRLLCVAALKPYKGLPVLLEALRLLRQRGRDVACDIVGEGPQRPELEALVVRHGLQDSVRLLGARRQDEVAELLRACAAFVLPSVRSADGQMEGIPVALMEAMAAERAVVSTRLSGIPELVEHERGGLLVTPGDAPELAGALQRVLDDAALRQRLGRAGRQAVLAGFRLDACTRRLLDELDAVNPPVEAAADLAALLRLAGIAPARTSLRARHARRDSRVHVLLASDGTRPLELVVKEHLDRPGASRPAAVRASDEHQALLRLHEAFAGPDQRFGVPRALASSGRSVLMEACRGLPLDERVRRSRETGPRALHDDLWRAGRWLREMQRLVGPTRVHGDFWPGNVFTSEDRVEVIDFEGMREGDAAEDAAWFLVHLGLFFAAPWRRSGLPPCEAAFLDGWGRPASDPALRRCRGQVARSLARRGDPGLVRRLARRLALRAELARGGA